MAEEPTTAREVERKLRVHGLFRLPDLVSGATGIARIVREDTRTLDAVYYDTVDLRLFRWGVTLRRREGGGDAGWHLKLPVDDGDNTARDEVRLPLDAGATGFVPERFANMVFPLTRGAPLAAVVELQTQRTPYLLHDALGTVFAELVDDTVSVIDEGSLVTRFREIEIEEAVEGADLDPVVAALVAVGATPDQRSKASVALGPATGRPPDVLPPEPVTPAAPAADLVVAILRRHARAFILQDVRVRRDLPDAVHQMRVAARRLRSTLKAFAPLVDVDWAEHLRGELGWAASELGAARDTEVLLARLDRNADELGGADARLVRAIIDPRLRGRLGQARDDAIESLSSDRHRRLLDDLVDAARNPQLTKLAVRSAGSVLPRLVERSFRRLERRVAVLDLSGPAQSWHEARIAAKRARYSTEAVKGIFGKPACELAEALESVTELLGEHQDACVAQDVLREMAASETIEGRTGFALGLLHEHEFEEELRARLEFEKVWPQVVRIHNNIRWDSNRDG